MVSILGANSVSGGYEVSNSLRFNDDDTARLTRTPSANGNQKTFTTSFWVKKGNISDCTIFSFGTGTTYNINVVESGSEFFLATNQVGVTQVWSGKSEGKYRDASAWYHVVIAIDTTQATSSNRVKAYINGNFVSNQSGFTYPSQNYNAIQNPQTTWAVGSRYDGNSPADMYLAEIHHIDGQQLSPTDFGEFDDNGVWIPKKYTGTHGTNGFFLEFKQTGTSANSSGIGADTSGNDNHFAVNNLAGTDVTEDTCTNNFATLNSVDTSSNITLTEGNTIGTANSNHSASRATIGLNSGKWYWENKIISDSGGPAVGVMAANAPLSDQLNSTPSRFYRDSGQKITDGTASNYGNTYTTNDIIGVALDLDNGAIYFYKNGTAENSGTAAFTDLLTATTEHWLPAIKLYNEAISINFGNPSFSISSGNNDGKYGNFEYAPPSGYYALCTKRLAEFG